MYSGVSLPHSSSAEENIQNRADSRIIEKPKSGSDVQLHDDIYTPLPPPAVATDAEGDEAKAAVSDRSTEAVGERVRHM